MSRRLKYAAFASALLVLATIAAVTTLLLYSPEQQIWHADDGTDAPETFLYVMFPTTNSVSCADPGLTTDVQAWERAILNRLDELDGAAVPAWDDATQSGRHVDARTMAFLPLDENAVSQQMIVMVRAIGARWPGRRIHRVEFDSRSNGKITHVTLRVSSERRDDTYEYSIKDRLLTPIQWRRRWQ